MAQENHNPNLSTAIVKETNWWSVLLTTPKGLAYPTRKGSGPIEYLPKVTDFILKFESKKVAKLWINKSKITQRFECMAEPIHSAELLANGEVVKLEVLKNAKEKGVVFVTGWDQGQQVFARPYRNNSYVFAASIIGAAMFQEEQAFLAVQEFKKYAPYARLNPQIYNPK